MKLVIQRVTKASVTVGEDLISSIGQGLCVLVGICREDTRQDCEYLAKKLLNLRLFEDTAGKRWCHSVAEKQLELLCISQFTLYCTLKGRKPDFHRAMVGEQSQELYNEFLDELGKLYKKDKIKDGVFGAFMQVHIQNDGPVTIELESPCKDTESKGKNKNNEKVIELVNVDIV